MNRTEFLDTLRSQLSGQMHEGKVAAHVRYYEDYIQSQVRSGRDEQQVLDELGDPRLIARTLLYTDVDEMVSRYCNLRSTAPIRMTHRIPRAPAGIMYMYGGLIPGTANFWAW